MFRDDIYVCPCCGWFFDNETNKPVEVDLNEFPDADFRESVLEARRRARKEGSQCGYKPKSKKAKAAKRGFAN